MDSGAFLVEDFVNAVSAQLDRVQDSLRMKAVNRPLTFALKDFSLDLQVFAEMDPEGNVRFRSAAPNETGASTLRLSFTTITRPMIEENTISLAATRSPTLDEIGLRPEERQRLEHLGVRNAAQLQALGQITGNNTVARYTGIPLNRIREALMLSRPNLHSISPAAPSPVQPPSQQVPPDQQVTHIPHRSPLVDRPSVDVTPHPGREVFLGPRRIAESPVEQFQPKVRPVQVTPVQSPAHPAAPVQIGLSPVQHAQPRKVEDNTQVLRIGKDISQLKLTGNNLVGFNGMPTVRLNSQSLDLDDADEDQVTVRLPYGSQSGPLEIELPGGQTYSYHLSIADDEPETEPPDPWAPRRQI